jgi:hypothetical protein
MVLLMDDAAPTLTEILPSVGVGAVVLDIQEAAPGVTVMPAATAALSSIAPMTQAWEPVASAPRLSEPAVAA